MIPTTKEAYNLFHRGSQVFARMEEQGQCVDVPYLKSTIKKLNEDIRSLKAQLHASDVWKLWSSIYKDKSTLGSQPQLARVVFKELGHKPRAKTESGDKDSTQESAFRGIDLPFIQDYFRLKKLQKLKSTYFENILREQQDGVLHPSFNLHTTVSYRSSSDRPNYQNTPVRDPVLGPMIRKAFCARPGNHLVEVDLAGAEVRVSYTYHHDPVMRDYLLDPSTDMHRDTAADLFLLPVEMLKANKDWAKRTVRDWAKNRFVFAQFYGDVYFQRAPHLWEAITEQNKDGYLHKLPDGTPIVDHLKAQGIRSLGACDPRMPPVPGTYEYLVQKAEKQFWQERFQVYTAWKKRHLRNYEGQGYFDLHTGFRCHGLYRKNQVLCIPVQGAAFHIELLGCILMQQWIDRYRMKSRLVGTIHDSTIADVPPDELQDYLTAIRHVFTVTIPKMWPWINIPLEVEAEVCPIGGSWDQKKVWSDKNGDWSPLGKA